MTDPALFINIGLAIFIGTLGNTLALVLVLRQLRELRGILEAQIASPKERPVGPYFVGDLPASEPFRMEIQLTEPEGFRRG